MANQNLMKKNLQSHFSEWRGCTPREIWKSSALSGRTFSQWNIAGAATPDEHPKVPLFRDKKPNNNTYVGLIQGMTNKGPPMGVVWEAYERGVLLPAKILIGSLKGCF